MLAYLFWHQPISRASTEAYEHRLASLHEELERAGVRSAVFRVRELPFRAQAGYEDWYLVEDWAALGALNEAAVNGAPGKAHRAVAELAGTGWGAVYALLSGDPEASLGARWAEKPRGEDRHSFLEREPAASVWQRQLVLGPAPEFCFGGDSASGRDRL